MDDDLLTAEMARAMYLPPYTLESVLRHIKSSAYTSQRVYGYNPKRMSDSIIQQLEDLGYVVERGDNEIKIRWDAVSAPKEEEK